MFDWEVLTFHSQGGASDHSMGNLREFGDDNRRSDVDVQSADGAGLSAAGDGTERAHNSQAASFATYRHDSQTNGNSRSSTAPVTHYTSDI